MTSSGGTINLPKTGQTKCYDASGIEISCIGTGQDGEIQAGVAWPNPRFTDKGDQTVLDNLTGLIWAKDGNAMQTRDPGFDSDSAAGDGMVTWQHALDYIKKLNQENHLGHNDWRLPNVIELESLVNEGQSNSANWLNTQGFTNVQAERYWSSTTYALNTSYAWIVSMYGGHVGYSTEAYYDFYVWPVRSGQSGSSDSPTISLPRTGQKTCYGGSGSSITCDGTGQDGELQRGVAWPITRFTTDGDQTATDNLTGLIWVRDGKTPGPAICGPGLTKTWHGALDYVKCLNTNNYLGRNDWRLPNRKELWSLVNASQSNSANWLNTQSFTNVQANYYWSSSIYANNSDFAWIVNIYDGYVGSSLTSGSNYIWPIRSGQSGSIASLAISKSGSGTVTSDPSGIDCGSTCSTSFSSGQSVTLTATPDTGSTFNGWSGACAGTGTCMVTMDTAKNVTATFTKTNHAPVASDSSIVVVKDMAAGAMLSANDADSDLLTYSIVTNGTKGTVSIADASTGAYAYTPNAGVTGADSFTFKANDGLVDSTAATVAITITTLPQVVPQVSGRIPDTGQTKCYNNTGEITCPQPGEAFNGQDGNYLIHPPSYTKLDASGNALPDAATSWAMIRDNVTGLIWENKTNDGSVHDGSKTFTWCDKNPATNGGNQGICGTGMGDAATDTEAFIKALNDAKFGGFSDWRMPTLQELRTITDISHSYVAFLNTHWFRNVVTTRADFMSYWSSLTSYIQNNGWAWYTYVGYVDESSKYITLSVRAVRGEKLRSLDDFIINGDGTVTDTATGLMWQQVDLRGTTWEEALSSAEGLELAGHNDWRLPNIAELQSIVDYGRFSPSINIQAFPGTMSSYYWSSSTDTSNYAAAWYVDFDFGIVSSIIKSDKYAMRAVRGGQSWVLGNLVISAPAQAARWNIGSQQTIIWDTANISGNVKITLSRQGGKSGTFTETIADNVPNNGSYAWTVTGPASVNSVLKIEPYNDASKGTTQGLFSIENHQVRLYLESNSPATFPKVSKIIELPDINDQLEISRQAVLFALSSDGWNWSNLGGILKLRIPPYWTANLYYVEVPDENNSLGSVFGYALNAEAMQYGPVREINFNTDEWSERPPHNVCETINNFGIITGAMGGVFSQCPIPNWGRFWVEPLSASTNSLTITKFGTGTGTVTSNPSGISCGSDCSESYSPGMSVTLTATPDTGSSFTGWSGACTGTGTCAITMDAVKSVTAAFTIQGVAMTAGNISVVKGETRQTTVTLTSVGGFSSALNLTYAWQGSAPANAVVNITPASVTPTPAGVSANVSVTSDASTGVGSYTLKVTATGEDTTAFANIEVMVANNLAFSTDAAISGVKGQALAPIQTGGGIGAAAFSLASGSLPPGVTLNSDGSFSGTPATRGTYSFTVKASDTDGHDVIRKFDSRIYDPAYRHLVLEEASWNVQQDAVTGWITVKVLDDYGASVIVAQLATIDISSSSLTGRFSTDGASWSGDNMLSPDIPAGSSSKRFKYKDATVGTFAITAAGVAGTPSEGWEDASHAIIVGGAVPFNLTVTKLGTGAGQVTASSGTIIWNGNTGSASHTGGTSVTLTATADAGAVFAGWGVDCSGTGTCTIGMFSDRNATATFNVVVADTSPPTDAGIVINDGVASTGSQQATLALSAADPSGLGQMRFSNDNSTWSDPVPFANTASWNLSAGNGQKTVYAKFSDAAGNWMTAAVSASITLSTVTVPANPSGLEIVGVEPGSISLKWNKNPEDGVTYHVFRSQGITGLYYRVNTAPVGVESFTWESGAFKVSFTDRGLKEGQTYYYKIQAVSGGVTSTSFSNVASAKTLTVEDYTVNVIDPTHIVSIGNMVKYYIQLLPRDKFKGTISLSLSGVPAGVTPDFIVSDESKGTSVTGLTLPATVTLQVTAGSATVAKEYRFQLIAQNFWTGGSSDPRETPLSLTVLPRDGAGIHVEVEKEILRKGEKVKIYGAILPTTETGRTVVLTLTPSGGSAQTKNVTTAPGGKFEDAAWISTLGVGTYTIAASWKDGVANQHTSASRSFTVEKGEVALTCLRKTGVQPTVGEDYTVMGSMKPIIPYAPLTLQIEDPDGVVTSHPVALDSEGQYARLGNFFTKKGIWKFKVYFDGNDDYIGAESNELIVPVGIEFGRAIILGGGEASQSNTLYWNVTKKLTAAAYRDFKAKGFRNDMIYYLINSQSIDVNYDDIPDSVVNISTPTVAAFLDAVKNQFAPVLNPDTPLFIYLQGHGTNDGRLMVLGSDQYLTAADLKDALDYLQGVGNYQGREGRADATVVVIVEACYSGSFIAQLSGQKRVILTSAGKDEVYNTDQSGQSSFSRRFFAKLLEGASLKKAFDYARIVQTNMGYPAPHLEDNGDGRDDAADGLLASTLYLNGELTWGLKPVVGTIIAPPVLDRLSSASISVPVTKGDVNIDKVWVQIIAPDVNMTSADDTISYPEVALARNEATGRYEGVLTELRTSGMYKLVVFAKDVNKELSDPGLAYITVSGAVKPGDINGDGDVNLADAILALQALSGLRAEGVSIVTGADVNGDGRIGLPEVVYIMQKAAEVR